jgi:hypothetical protein
LPLSPGIRYLKERQLRAEVEKEYRDWEKNLGSEILQELEKTVVKSRVCQNLSREASGKDLDMLCNIALLIRRDMRENFLSQIKLLQQKYINQNLAFETSGPWPPYRFCPELTTTE